MNVNAINPLTKYDIYVANSAEDTISVINGGKEIETILVGLNPVAMIEVNSGTEKFIYVINKKGLISIISPSDKKVVKLLQLPGLMSNIFNSNLAVNEDNSKLYIANINSVHKSNGWISVIDIANQSIEISIPVMVGPTYIAITKSAYPGADKLYVTNNDSHTISVIDLTTNKVTSSFLVKHHPDRIIISPDNKYFFIQFQDGNEIHYGSVKTDTIIGEVKTHTFKTRCIEISWDGQLLYAGVKHHRSADNSSSKLRVYNLIDKFHLHAVISLIPHAADVRMIQQINITEDYDNIYISEYHNNKNTEIFKLNRHITSNTIEKEKSLHIRHYPGFFTITPDKKYLILASVGSNSLFYVNADSLEIEETIDTTTAPHLNGPELIIAIESTQAN